MGKSSLQPHATLASISNTSVCLGNREKTTIVVGGWWVLLPGLFRKCHARGTPIRQIAQKTP
eukprot:1159041-Pelagomonas_calceolata.AAC.8